jgi:hypothetical protein
MNESLIETSLSSFEPISLDSISTASLMNRVDIKFVFSAGKISDLINLLSGKYRILEINNLRLFPYLTTYLDTPGYLFYNQHVRGEYDRYKIRYRKYDTTGVSFLEVKKKNNKSRTIKWRIENEQINGSFDDSANIFIKKYLPFNSLHVKPSLETRFVRMTFIGLRYKERVTVDFNISFMDLIKGIGIEVPFLAIAEIKQYDHLHRSPFVNMIKQLGVYPNGFSKYCVGSAILNDSVKKNLMKSKLLLINKIENEYVSTHTN